MKRREVLPSDRAALQRAARSERAAKERWDVTLEELHLAIRRASENGASLRAIATTIGRSHGRVRDLLHPAPPRDQAKAEHRAARKGA